MTNEELEITGMTKAELKKRLIKYREIFSQINRWLNPIVYELDKNKALLHIQGIKKLLNETIYKNTQGE